MGDTEYVLTDNMIVWQTSKARRPALESAGIFTRLRLLSSNYAANSPAIGTGDGKGASTSALSLPLLFRPGLVNEFISIYFGRKPFHLARECPTHYLGLFSADEFLHFIAQPNFRAEHLTVASMKSDVEPTCCANADGSLNYELALQLFRDGATLSLRELHIINKKIGDLCKSVGLELGCRAQSNAYLSPSNSRGIRTHSDPHDVFVLQISGTKTWKIFAPSVIHPLPCQHAIIDEGALPELILEVETKPGDLLYFPRGFPHNATASATDSLHVTLGVTTWTWLDLFVEGVADVALRDSAFRDGIPYLDLSDLSSRKIVIEQFEELLARLTIFARPIVALNNLCQQTNERSPISFVNPPAVAGVAFEMDLGSVLLSNRFCRSSLSCEKGQAILRWDEHELRAPAFTFEALSFAKSTIRFTVEELAGELSSQSKIVLARKLVDLGFLRLATELS